MLASALLIHLTGGRIETHFHVFGSLAVLAFYRDWRVLVTATAVVALDHFFRGLFWPSSVYGVASGAEWRWIEHSGWVIFEDAFLIFACLHSHREMRAIALRQAEIESKNTVLSNAIKQAQAASQAKSEFLACMSHEIRTPLNGVMGTIDLLLGTQLTMQQQRYGQIAKSSAESLTTVINDILDFSKVEAGKLEIVAGDVNVQRVVEEVIEMLAPNVTAKGLKIACHTDPDVPALVRADGDRLRQVLINLINNAIKFTERGSVVARVTADALEGGRAVIRFTISDTGIGISPDRYDRLFKSFSQADASTTRAYGGTGLGLAISKQLAELMGGEIGVESELGFGSTFWFTIAVEVKEEPSASGPRPRLDPRTLRVLAVEDDELQRDVLRRQIESWGFEAATAADGVNALKILGEAAASSKPFRVALCDGDMPGMDAFELAAAVKARADTHGTVLMILLCVEARIDPDRLRALGFSGQMTKPVRQSHLFDAIMDAIAASRRDPTPVDAGPAASASIAESTPCSTPGGGRILLAEDNEINQIVAREILTQAGYECDIAANGRLAIDAVIRRSYDLILMDCQMPELDGFDATREIRRLEEAGASAGGPGRRIPVIALTANAMKGDRERCLEAGMDAYASKPINPEQLKTTIRTLLQQSEERHAA
jgi:signal transduction histidine kinase/DNA-binding response OmpR family regulator